MFGCVAVAVTVAVCVSLVSTSPHTHTHPYPCAAPLILPQVFDRSAGNRIVGTVAGLTRGVFSVDWHQHRLLAIAGGDAAVRLYEIQDGLDTPAAAAEGKMEE